MLQLSLCRPHMCTFICISAFCLHVCAKLCGLVLNPVTQWDTKSKPATLLFGSFCMKVTVTDLCRDQMESQKSLQEIFFFKVPDISKERKQQWKQSVTSQKGQCWLCGSVCKGAANWTKHFRNLTADAQLTAVDCRSWIWQHSGVLWEPSRHGVSSI